MAAIRQAIYGCGCRVERMSSGAVRRIDPCAGHAGLVRGGLTLDRQALVIYAANGHPVSFTLGEAPR